MIDELNMEPTEELFGAGLTIDDNDQLFLAVSHEDHTWIHYPISDRVAFALAASINAVLIRDPQ